MHKLKKITYLGKLGYIILGKYNECWSRTRQKNTYILAIANVNVATS